MGGVAGFACPLETGGIHYVMLSGKIAAEVAAETISGGDSSAEGGIEALRREMKKSVIGEEFSAAKEWAAAYSHNKLLIL